MLESRPNLSITALLCFLLFFGCMLFFFNFDHHEMIRNRRISPEIRPQQTFDSSKYLVYSSKCKISNLEPFNSEAKPFYKPEKYYSCSKRELLTYVTKKDNIATLNIDTALIPSYTKNGIACCYANITRGVNPEGPDDEIKISKCEDFPESVVLNWDTILVKCRNSRTKKQIYENVHTSVTLKPNLELSSPNKTSKFSVLIVGIDSISRLNLIRTMPKTYRYLEDHQWVPLLGYNKIDDNTFPNLMAIFAGYNQSYAYEKCVPTVVGKLDQCPFIWNSYKDRGYVTAYAEDDGDINTFNYHKKGFSKPPTHYYFRPYILGSEKLTIERRNGILYCTGPETAGERIFNVAKDFVFTFKEYLSFGFFWMNSFSHNEINAPSGMDLKVRRFLQDIEPILEDTIVIFLSDHGIRFGKIRYTFTGWYEERLPFIYVSLPKRFKKLFPNQVKNFKENANKLTNPYDLHMTLQHILVLSKLNKELIPSNGCPNCKSLFEKIETERSCKDAAIDPHWCTCVGYTPISMSSNIVMNASNFVLSEIFDIIRGDKKCAKYSVSKIISSQLSNKMTNETFLLVVFETKPKAVFEGTVSYVNEHNFKLEGGISRLDSYASSSGCTTNVYLKKFCHCVK